VCLVPVKKEEGRHERIGSVAGLALDHGCAFHSRGGSPLVCEIEAKTDWLNIRQAAGSALLLSTEGTGPVRRCSRTRFVGPRTSESVEGKEVEAGDSMATIADEGRHIHSALAAGRSQDGVLQ